MYTTELASESRMVALRMSPSSFGVKDRFILREAMGSWGDRCGAS